MNQVWLVEQKSHDHPCQYQLHTDCWENPETLISHCLDEGDVQAAIPYGQRLITLDKMLWLLDNFEHLLDHTLLLSDWLQQLPYLKIMVTSRAILDLAEEWLYQVEGLSYPIEGPPPKANQPRALPAPTNGRCPSQPPPASLYPHDHRRR